MRLNRSLEDLKLPRKSGHEVLRWIRDTRFAAPVNIEQEAPGWDRVAIARQALQYCRKALTG